ncbi:hypothetical protein I546_1882 [Mycobacterium kansasii 732]|nr:hypothetical protein I546_1882 [Mycobacterium kansasii 732]
MHWVRDATFDEDRHTAHTGSGAQVLATLRNTAINLHRLNGADNIAEACRVTALSASRPPRPPQPPIPQLTSLLINNAGALPGRRPAKLRPIHRPSPRATTSHLAREDFLYWYQAGSLIGESAAR